MSTQVALSQNHPFMLAWKKFTETAEYSNALKWSLAETYEDGREISAENRRNHVEGGLWLAFTKGMELASIPGSLPSEELTKLEYKDRLKIRELCSTCQVRLFEILGQLDSILNVLRAIDVPELSSYTKIELKQKTAIEKTVSETVNSLPQQVFKPPIKQDLASIAMTLARNLELNLKKE